MKAVVDEGASTTPLLGNLEAVDTDTPRGKHMCLYLEHLPIPCNQVAVIPRDHLTHLEWLGGEGATVDVARRGTMLQGG
jgi:hypothetical protein